jgi:hypothetical protein
MEFRQIFDSVILLLAICWLVSWRMTAMLCYEAGPYKIFSMARKALQKSNIRVLNCFHCTGFWISCAIVLVLFGFQWPTAAVAVAVSGAVSMTERFLGGGILERGPNE